MIVGGIGDPLRGFHMRGKRFSFPFGGNKRVYASPFGGPPLSKVSKPTVNAHRSLHRGKAFAFPIPPSM